MESIKKKLIVKSPLLLGFSIYYFISIIILIVRQYYFYDGNIYFKLESLFTPLLSPFLSLVVIILNPFCLLIYMVIFYIYFKIFNSRNTNNITKCFTLAILLVVYSEFSLFIFDNAASTY